MSRLPITQSPVDHYIQGDILRDLYKSELPIAFSELKPDGIENSLFMYHLNKLLSRGVVEKSETGGYSLTVKGVRWTNYVDFANLHAQLLPKSLINFLITNDDGSKLLLSKRVGAAAKLINQYILPGGLYSYGVPLAQSASIVAQKRLGTIPEMSLLGIAEVIYRSEDYAHHSMIYMHRAQYSTAIVPVSEELYELQWIELKQILTDPAIFESSPFVVRAAQKLQDVSFEPFETFEFVIK